jgi:hypothetical protein
MSERKDEKWLDKQLQRAVDGTTPVFDAQTWKQKHRDEYRILLSRGSEGNPPASNAGRTVRVVLGSWIGRLAVAAMVAVAVGLFVLGRGGHGPNTLIEPPGPVAQASPARMMSMMSLRMAYQQGGFEALDRQLQDTLDEFGPRSSSVPVRELFNM